MFIPDNSKYAKLYPKYTDTHYIKITKNRGYVFDKDYPYVDNSKKFKRKRRFIRFLIVTIVFLLARIRMGVKIKGRKYLKQNKKILKEGVISVSNHVHMWDYLAILIGIRYHKPNYLAWGKNVNGKDGKLVRLTGGIPIPENDIEATKAYLKQVKDYLDKGGWLHIYAEGSMWEYYPFIRPFKRGLGYLSNMSNKPILPIGISYRKPNFIRRSIFRQKALININIGELIYMNNELSKKEREIDLIKRSHEAVCKLCGIDNNIYPYLFSDSEKIEYEKSI